MVTIVMRYRSVVLLATGVVAGLAAGLLLTGTPAIGQEQAPYQAPRSIYGDGRPDLNGIWQALTTANWNVEAHPSSPGYSDGPAWMLGALVAEPGGLGVVEGGRIPYQPWAFERRNENFRNRLVADVYKREQGDGELKCFMPGPVRATYMPYPFQILQTDKYVNISYQFANSNRIIHLTNHQEPVVDGWMGWSNGRWEGDALVVEVVGLMAELWLDRSGNFLGEGARVTERYTRIGPDHLRYEATIENPKVFTRPWTISLPLYRHIDPRAEIVEFNCVEYAEETMFGRVTRDWTPPTWDPFTQQTIE